MATLTVVAINDTYLSPQYLDYFIAAFNQQDCSDFNVIWLNQARDPQVLTQALQSARFQNAIIHMTYPYLGHICCWEIPQTLTHALVHPAMGTYFAFLHKECLPAPDFVSSLLEGVSQAEAALGPNSIYILNQLRCPLTIEDVVANPDWHTAMQTTPAQSWSQRNIFQRPAWAWREERWLEDTFCVSVALAMQLQCFSCVQVPLFFQDVFDLFLQLSERAYCQHIHWVRMGGGILYHLNHPRLFYELGRPFLQQVRQHPEWFGHLALYEFADSDFDYIEPFEQGERLIDFKINRAIHYLQYSENGTMTLWMQALDRHHGFTGGL